jgi:hypothetical protein
MDGEPPGGIAAASQVSNSAQRVHISPRPCRHSGCFKKGLTLPQAAFTALFLLATYKGREIRANSLQSAPTLNRRKINNLKFNPTRRALTSESRRQSTC